MPTPPRLLECRRRRAQNASAGVLAGPGPVAIHADPGPYNVIVDPESGQVRALIDWELARLGDPIEDLALVEWYARNGAMIERCRGCYASSPDDVRREQLRRTEAFEERLLT